MLSNTEPDTDDGCGAKLRDVAFYQWGGHGAADLPTSLVKQSLLYNVVAGAVTFATGESRD